MVLKIRFNLSRLLLPALFIMAGNTYTAGISYIKANSTDHNSLEKTIPAILTSESDTSHNKMKHGMKHSMKDTTKEETGDMKDMHGHEMESVETDEQSSMGSMNMQEMNGSVLLTDPMTVEASGTSWQPQASPMYMTMYNISRWMVMLHGDIKLRYNSQGGPRGRSQVSAPNWFMVMGQKRLGESSQIMLRTMISLDRITEGGNGYPLLFQTGETWHNLPLIDRQHPHDLVSELSASISREFSQSLSGYLYLGYPGEPALGPPVFMHRVSASPNPDAPIGHHWQDATHITFGVATLGLAFGSFKLEGSFFNGREPDENRFDFDRPRFNSYSGRISYNPLRQLAFQLSSGVLKDPEGTGPADKVYRTTASAIYSILGGRDSYFSSAFIWGVNNEAHSEAQNSFLIEPAYNFYDNTVYARLELVQKPRHELGIDIEPFLTENVGAYTLGYMRKLLSFSGIDLNAGIQGSVYSMPQFVKQYYGNPFSFEIYLGINPSLMLH